MICCDVCWIVLGKSTESEDLIDKGLFFVGKWEVCKECLNKIEVFVFEWIKDKRFKLN